MGDELVFEREDTDRSNLAQTVLSPDYLQLWRLYGLVFAKAGAAWSAENPSDRIDLLVQRPNGVYAIEVKAEEDPRARSLRAFKDAHPEITSLRFSLSGYREQDWMRNVPLYAVSNMGLRG